MTHKHKEQNRLSKSKIIAIGIVLLIIGIVIFVGIITYQSPIKRKLIGSWNIEFENSYIERDSIYQFLEIIINIQKDTINLPQLREPLVIDFQCKTFLGNGIEFDEETIQKNIKRNKEMRQKATGVWQVISTNPDSVFFNVPKNPLHGKYAVRFFIDENGWISWNMPRNIYKIELTNDSTYLICNKGGIMYTKDVRDWEGKN